MPKNGAATPRNTSLRDAHRRTIAKGKPPCGICGEDIDYTLTYPEAGCYVVDHVYPRAKGGTDTLDNKQPAHNRCNRAKSDKLGAAAIIVARTFVTTREW